MAPSTSTGASATDYTRRVDELVVKTAHAFQEVVRSSQIQDRASDARSAFQIDVETANIAHNCESLLRVISELKVACIVQDAEVSQRDAAKLVQEMNMESQDINSRLDTAAEEASQLLRRLERHFYTSQSGLPLNDQHPDDRPPDEPPSSKPSVH